MDRSAALDAAKRAVADRPNSYGKPEQNFDRIRYLWNVHLNNRGGFSEANRDIKPISAGDVAIMLALVKIARLEADPTHADSWIDMCGYAACGAEVSGAVENPGNLRDPSKRWGDYLDRPAQTSDLVDDCLHQAARDREGLSPPARPPWGFLDDPFIHGRGVTNTPRPESKFGFTVGETVNIKTDPIGSRPGRVVGFDDDGVQIRWSHHGVICSFDPDYLRHGE